MFVQYVEIAIHSKFFKLNKTKKHFLLRVWGEAMGTCFPEDNVDPCQHSWLLNSWSSLNASSVDAISHRNENSYCNRNTRDVSKECICLQLYLSWDSHGSLPVGFQTIRACFHTCEFAGFTLVIPKYYFHSFISVDIDIVFLSSLGWRLFFPSRYWA